MMHQVMKPRVVLFGSLGVAVNCLEWLLQSNCYEILGVVCTRQPRSPWRVATRDLDMQEIAPKWGIPLLTMKDVLTINADIGLSVRFDQILRREHLERFRLGVVNLHGAPLPEMRGSMCDAAAILEDRREFGTSLHWMDEGIDTGPVLAVYRFPIDAGDTVYDLFCQSNIQGLELIKATFNDIVNGRLQAVTQEQLMRESGVEARTYYANQVKCYKIIPHGLSSYKLSLRLRAFKFPGHEPPRYQDELFEKQQSMSLEMRESRGK